MRQCAARNSPKCIVPGLQGHAYVLVSRVDAARCRLRLLDRVDAFEDVTQTQHGLAPNSVQLGTGVLRVSLQALPLNCPVDDAIAHIMGGFGKLDVHQDIRGGLPALAALATRLVTLSNGARAVAQQLLARADLSSYFERLLSTEDAGVWKPAPGAYAYAATQCTTAPADMMLVTVHPWDIGGADRAGQRTAWINRNGATYPDHFRAPTLEASSLLHLAQLLTR